MIFHETAVSARIRDSTSGEGALASTHCWAALVRPEADTRHELGKCNAKRWALPTYRL